MGQMENHWQRIQHTSLLPKFKPANVFPIQILKLTMNLSLCLHWKWLALLLETQPLLRGSAVIMKNRHRLRQL